MSWWLPQWNQWSGPQVFDIVMVLSPTGKALVRDSGVRLSYAYSSGPTRTASSVVYMSLENAVDRMQLRGSMAVRNIMLERRSPWPFLVLIVMRIPLHPLTYK